MHTLAVNKMPVQCNMTKLVKMFSILTSKCVKCQGFHCSLQLGLLYSLVVDTEYLLVATICYKLQIKRMNVGWITYIESYTPIPVESNGAFVFLIKATNIMLMYLLAIYDNLIIVYF